MRLILRIAFRNLFRQKSRSFLMGLGIASGMMILVVAHSFSNGIVPVVVENVIASNAFGHLSVAMTEKSGSSSRSIIRDKDEMAAMIREHTGNVRTVYEGCRTRAYAIGNGAAAMIALMSIPESSETALQDLTLIDGDFPEFGSDQIETPILLAHQWAEYLEVKAGDRLSVRMETIYGQVQTAQLSIAAIVKSNNPLIGELATSLLPLKDLKRLMGYTPNEAQILHVTLEDADDMQKIADAADRLQQGLLPLPVHIVGTFGREENSSEGILAGFRSSDASVDVYRKHINVLRGDIEAFSGKSGKMLIEKSLAEQLQIGAGSTVSFSYEPRFTEEAVNRRFEVAAVIDDLEGSPAPKAFINDGNFYETYLNHLPEKTIRYSNGPILLENSPLIPIIANSWKRANRAYTTLEMEKKRREIRRTPFSGRIVDITTMQETFGNLVGLEPAVYTISFAALLVVFSIILVGILNAVRMNIKERTREIGTVRAVGMQKRQVRHIVVAEIGFLSLLSSILGVIAAYVLMNLFTIATFPPTDNLAMLLSNGHFKFIPNLSSMGLAVLVIIAVTMVAVYLPARKAAKLPIAEALGHYE